MERINNSFGAFLDIKLNNIKEDSLSIILPVYNEEDNIIDVIREILNFLKTQNIFNNFEIIIVNDGSVDNTEKILVALKEKISFLKLVMHAKNLGYGKSLMDGFTISQFPLVLFMDSDGQFSFREIIKLVPWLEEFDVVTGYRYKRCDPFYRIILGIIYRWLIFLILGIKFKDINCGFKLFRREILAKENIYSKRATFYAEIFLRLKKKGYKIKEIPVQHFPRLKGRQKGFSIRIMLSAIFDLIRIRYLVKKEDLDE